MSYSVLPPVASAPPVYASPGYAPVDARARFDDFVSLREISPIQADDLYGVLTTTRIVLLLDDSGSMSTRVTGGDAGFVGGGVLTRWAELNTLAACIVDIVTSTNPAGLDCHFLNRPGLMHVTHAQQLAPAFLNPPRGGTPLLGALRSIFLTYGAEAAAGRRVLVVVITDGEPSDGSVDDLFYLLQRGRHPNFHISLAECNDNEEEMAYLDSWDRRLVNFDNTDDYRMELARVKRAKGSSFRFTYMDYAVKILLGSLMRKYFMLDQSTMGGDCSCCAVS